MTDLTFKVYDDNLVQFTYNSGRRTIQWSIHSDDDDLLEILADIVDAVSDHPAPPPLPPIAAPLNYIEPPVAVKTVDPQWAAAAKQGVSWDNEEGVDSLPVM